MSHGDVLRVGIIGCGQATQALHVPALNTLARRFEVACVCDASEGVAAALGRRLGARSTTSAEAVFEHRDIDVVLIASPDPFHAEHALLACEARPRAVLLEKPVAISSRIAREIAAASQASGVPIVTHYPHVYDPVFARALDIWGSCRAATSGEVHILMAMAGTYTGDEILETVAPAPTVGRWPEFGLMSYALQTTELLGIQIGVELVFAHSLLAGILIHEFPVLRRLLGEPERVQYAAIRPARGVMDPLGFGVDFVLSVGGGSIFVRLELQPMRMTDWGYRLRRDGLAIAVRYPFPYASQAPATLTATREDGGMSVDEVHSGRYETGVRGAWKHLHDVAMGRCAALTPASDAVRDLEVVEDVLRALKAGASLGVAS